MRRSESVSTPRGDVSLIAEGTSDGDVHLVLGHGAGGDMHASFMSSLASSLASEGAVVWRFNFPYSEVGRRAPDPQPVLEQTFGGVVERVRELSGDAPLVLGGKSMGGRIASHIVASGTDCDGLVFLGYPLHPPGKPDRLRVEHLHRIKVPILFLEGTRDPFCPLDTLNNVLERLDLDARVVTIDDGDHSFKVRASSGRSSEEAWRELSQALVGWLQEIKTGR